MADTSLKDLTGAVYKIAENSPKIQKDVKDIRDAICGTAGIRDSIVYLGKQLENIQKKGTINKLTGGSNLSGNRNLIRQASNISSTLNKILDTIQKQQRPIDVGNMRLSRLGGGRDLGNISKSIDIVNGLKGIKLKDFIFAKKKIKNIQKIMSRYLATFRMFKDQKEMEGTLNFANSSVDLMKKLSKISIISVPAKIGAKTIQKIFLGSKKDKNGGLIGVFRKISENKKHIERGKKSMKDILSSCGSMLLTSIILTGIAAFAIPAMAGALLMKGIVWLMTGTFVALDKVKRPVKKGSLTLLVMSASVVTFALGLGLMMKAIKGMKLKDVGLMMSSIAGLGLTVAGVGLLAAPIAIGSATLLLLGASLGVFGLSVSYWKTIDVKPAIGNIKLAVEGLRDTFGLELGKGDNTKTIGQRLKGGLMDIAMGVLNFGKSFFVMGQLLLAGAALGLLYHGLKNWDNFNGQKAAGNIESAVGSLKKVFGIEDTKQGENLKGKLKNLGGGVLDMGVALLQGGKSLAQMATITIATGMADVIRVTLIPWKNFDAKPAAKNLKEAFASLKDAFGLEDKTENFGQKTLRFLGGPLDLASTLFSAGGVMVKMGTIMLATGLADIIKLNLKPWANYDSTAINNLDNAIGRLKSIFGLEDRSEGLGSKIINTTGSLFDLATSFLQGGAAFAKMGSITLATALAGKIKDNLTPWETYTGAEKAIGNIRVAIDGLLNIFGFDAIERANENKNMLQQIGGIFKGVGKVVKSTVNAVGSAIDGGSALAKIGTITSLTKMLGDIKTSLEPWEKSDVTKAIHNMNKSINTINSIDVEKASTLVEVFKSFSHIKSKPIDTFTQAVAKFSESCSELIESLNEFSETNSKISVTSGGQSPTGETVASSGFSITNKDELADAIAKAIKSLPVNVRTDISDVKLVINNETGRRVVLTLDN